jgi:hypothetical protein
MVLKLHGTSGSGKTTAVRELMELAESIEVVGPSKQRPLGYCLKFEGERVPTFVVGSYESTCGGVDTISKADELVSRIACYVPHGHVVFEGLLVSTYLGKVYGFLKTQPDTVWAFMDTHIEECVERVKKRRLTAGNVKPFNEDNTRNRVRAIQAVRAKVCRMGEKVVDIDGSGGTGRQLLSILYPIRRVS